jgi:hypothetical protein
MRRLAKKIFLFETSPALRTAYIDTAEWDPDERRFYVGDLVIPESAAKEWQAPKQPEGKPEASTPAQPAPTVRKGPPRKI